MKNKKNVSDNTHAAENLYGYGLQVRQMLYELLNCEKDCTVSVEKFDDVGVENDMTKKQFKQKVLYQVEIPFQICQLTYGKLYTIG